MPKNNNKQQNQPTPEQLDQERQTKQAELEALSDSELDARYLATFGSEGPEIPRDEVIRLILENTPENPAPKLNQPDKLVQTSETNTAKKQLKKKIFKDEKGNEYEIEGAQGLIVVKQTQLDVQNGGMYEVPNSTVIQTYKPDVWERLNEQKFFEESRIKTEILK